MMRSVLAGALLMLLGSPAFSADREVGGTPDSLQVAFDETITTARRAIDKYGVTDSAMIRIQAALAQLASKPSLKDRDRFQKLHGGAGVTASMLASEGEDSISLFIARFDTGHATPVHDHLTWGVIHVLEGRDRYIQWEYRYRDGDSSRAEIRQVKEMVLEPGGSTYWLPPPHDLHSQEGKGMPVWELVLAGRNLLSRNVIDHRHYYDPKTGSVTNTPPK